MLGRLVALSSSAPPNGDSPYLPLEGPQTLRGASLTKAAPSQKQATLLSRSFSLPYRPIFISGEQKCQRPARGHPPGPRTPKVSGSCAKAAPQGHRNEKCESGGDVSASVRGLQAMGPACPAHRPPPPGPSPSTLSSQPCGLDTAAEQHSAVNLCTPQIQGHGGPPHGKPAERLSAAAPTCSCLLSKGGPLG